MQKLAQLIEMKLKVKNKKLKQRMSKTKRRLKAFKNTKLQKCFRKSLQMKSRNPKNKARQKTHLKITPKKKKEAEVVRQEAEVIQDMESKQESEVEGKVDDVQETDKKEEKVKEEKVEEEKVAREEEDKDDDFGDFEEPAEGLKDPEPSFEPKETTEAKLQDSIEKAAVIKEKEESNEPPEDAEEDDFGNFEEANEPADPPPETKKKMEEDADSGFDNFQASSQPTLSKPSAATKPTEVEWSLETKPSAPMPSVLLDSLHSPF
eukprot:TRINITY_DN7506_c0_g1_i2.p1 TRINITY_DN7506_c0_g1~~TRINITY_DN7506_c0_g1_i2.p1  ORF type:complete len:263 (+),score=73.09 TRINITY_DN7506_c0_g1_i2:868-1656(+)